MKLQCKNYNLKEAVIIAERNTAKNQTLPVLNSLLIDADKDQIKIRATNLENAIEIIVPGKIVEHGSLAVPAKIFGSFLSNIGDEQVTIQSAKSNLLIKTNSVETIIQGYPLEDFPIFPKIDAQEKISISGEELGRAMSSVIVASSNSDVKPELSSVFFNMFKNTLKVAATDSFRLAEKVLVSKKIQKDKQISFLLPFKGAGEILRLLNTVAGNDVEIGVSKNQFVLAGGNFVFISRLIEGKFPEYEQILPKGFKTTAYAKKSDIASHIKLASVFSGKSNEIRINFSPTKKNILINTSQSDIGEHSSQIASMIQGSDISLKFNEKYLSDGISQIDGEYVEFNLNSTDSPLLIKSKGDNSYFYLVMPMRVS